MSANGSVCAEAMCTVKNDSSAKDVLEFLSMRLPTRQYVLEPVIPEQGLVMLYALRGVGKTFVALSVALAVSKGFDVFDWGAPRARKVLYLDGEMSASNMQERLKEIVKGLCVAPPSEGMLMIINPDLLADGERMPNLATPEGQRWLEPYLEGVELLIVDNLATLAGYGDENDTRSWRPVQDWLLGLKKRGMSVLLVHHAGKGGQQRGTSSREDVLDTVIALKRPHDYSPEQGARFEVHLEKARGIFGEDAKSFEAKLVEYDWGSEWEIQVIEDVESTRVQELLSMGMSIRDIADETGMSKSKVHRIKQSLYRH